MSERDVFNGDFAELWSLTKYYSKKQRQIIMRSLPKAQREKLEKSYTEQGWADLFIRNQLDKYLDKIKKEYGQDLLQIRMWILQGKHVYVNKRFWDRINEEFKGYAAEQCAYIFGGYRVTQSESNENEYLLISTGGK